MIYFMFIVSVILLAIILYFKRGMSRVINGPSHQWIMFIDHPKLRKTAKYLFLKGGLEFFIPFAITAFIYSALQLWLDVSLHSVNSTTTIKEVEECIRKIRINYVAPIKLSDSKQLFAIFALVLLGYFFPKLARLQVLNRYKQVSLYISRIYILLTLLTSLTFFGSQFDKNINAQTARLSNQIDEIEVGYADYQSALEGAAKKAVAHDIADDENNKDVVSKITGMVNDAIRIKENILAINLQVTNYPYINIRDFDLEIDRFDKGYRPPPGPSGKGPKGDPPTPPPVGSAGTASKQTDSPSPSSDSRGVAEDLHTRHQVTGKERMVERSGDWSMAASEQMKAELKEVEQNFKGGGQIAEVIEKSVDAVHSDVIKKCLVDMLPDGGLKSLFDIGLDADVLYNFKDRVAELTDKLFELTAKKRQSLKEAITKARESLRTKISASIQNSKNNCLRQLNPRSEWLSKQKSALESIKRQTPHEIEVKANRQFARNLASFRKDWGGTYNFGEYDVTGASTNLRKSIEQELATIKNPLERIDRLKRYGDGLKFSSNQGETLQKKYESLTQFENRYLNTDRFKTDTSQWFKPARPSEVSIRKYCGKCTARVPDSSSVGQRCPFCGVLWTYETEKKETGFDTILPR